MTAKADFNADEWDRLREGPPAAALIVIAATLEIERSMAGPAPADEPE